MRYWILTLLTICIVSLNAQTVDSVAVRQVDSLIKIIRLLIDKEDFDKAIEVNTIAEKLTLEKLGKETAAYGNCCFIRGRVKMVH